MLPAFDPMLTIIFFLNSRGIFLSLCRESVPWEAKRKRFVGHPGGRFAPSLPLSHPLLFMDTLDRLYHVPSLQPPSLYAFPSRRDLYSSPHLHLIRSPPLAYISSILLTQSQFFIPPLPRGLNQARRRRKKFILMCHNDS